MTLKTSVSCFTGATSTSDGTSGYVPAPSAGMQDDYYLCGNGEWVEYVVNREPDYTYTLSIDIAGYYSDAVKTGNSYVADNGETVYEYTYHRTSGFPTSYVQAVTISSIPSTYAGKDYKTSVELLSLGYTITDMYVTPTSGTLPEATGEGMMTGVSLTVYFHANGTGYTTASYSSTIWAAALDTTDTVKFRINFYIS